MSKLVPITLFLLFSLLHVFVIGEINSQVFDKEKTKQEQEQLNIYEANSSDIEEAPPHKQVPPSVLQRFNPIVDRINELEANIKLNPFENDQTLLSKLQNWKRKNNLALSQLEKLLYKYADQLSQISAITTSSKQIPGQEVCGTALSRGTSYIIDGVDSEIEHFPWMVQLQVAKDISTGPDPPFRFRTERCSAAIISHEWLLTAAHCVTETRFLTTVARTRPGLMSAYVQNPEIMSKLGAKVGMTRTLNESDEVLSFKEIIIREGYNSNTKANDIALVRLEIPLNFSSTSVRPMCLPEPGELVDLEKGDLCTVAGWGAIQVQPEIRFPKNLKAGEVFIKDVRNCNRTYKRLPPLETKAGVLVKLTIPEGHICAGGLHGTPDVCFRDSGAPLMCSSPKTGRLLATGVVSFGPTPSQLKGRGSQKDKPACGTLPSAYTDLRPHLPWLLQHVLTNSTYM